MALKMEKQSIKKLYRSRQFIKSAGLNKTLNSNDNHGKGIITSGLTCLSLLDVFETARYKPDILKLSAINPLEEESILQFLSTHNEILVLDPKQA